MKARVAMADSSLKDLWTAAKDGNLSPLEQSRAWALREVYREMGIPEKKLYTKIAEKLTKAGGNEAPGSRAVLKLFAKIDGDEDWYPGKVAEGRGRKPALSGLARNAIKRSAEAMKSKGGEPTFNLICGSCPEAVKNPETSNPVDKKRVYDVFRKDCYDEGADEPWTHRKRLQKKALPDLVIQQRVKWHKWMEGLGHTSDWYYKSLIWIDLCNHILPRTQKVAARQALARKDGSGWMSEGCQQWSRNLKGSKDCLKQGGWGTIRVWWMPVLTRGKLHVEVFVGDFPGENPEGAQQAVEKLGSILNLRFPNDSKPKVLFTDKGKGFYQILNSQITPEYKAATRSVGLRPFMGDDASKQPATMGDLMLHETAVAWLRKLMGWSTPKEPWLETPEEVKARMQEACRKVSNENQNLISHRSVMQ